VNEKEAEKEAEMVQQTEKLVSKTKVVPADTDAKNLSRGVGTNQRRSPANP
jgi:hypothetical protein